MSTLPTRDAPGGSAHSVIAALQGVSKHFGARAALEAVCLLVRSEEVTAVLGPSGAGKSTAVRLLLGLIVPDTGRVEVLGRDPRTSAARAGRGAMLHGARPSDLLTVREHIELFRSYYPHPLRTAEILRRTELTSLEHQRAGTLSGGERQRLLLALAICGDPPLLCLDEPTTGLDSRSRLQIWDSIRELARAGKAVLLTTPSLEEADALADRIGVLAQGHLSPLATPAEIKRSVPASQPPRDALIAPTGSA